VQLDIASFWRRSPRAATRPATRSPAWMRFTSCWTPGCARPATSGCTPRPDRVAPEPSQNLYSHFAWQGGAGKVCW